MPVKMLKEVWQFVHIIFVTIIC